MAWSLRCCAVGILFTLAFSARHSVAADPPQAGNLQAQLDAGEFGAALASAENLPAGPERDSVLAQIALAQNAVGARQAALSSIFRMTNDQNQATALNQLGPSAWPGANSNRKKDGKPGGNDADFDSLIDLITSTIAPTSWVDAGGSGSVKPFPTGVYVDADGVMHRLAQDQTGGVAAVRRSAATAGQSANARQPSTMRKVSLTRLEKEVRRLAAMGRKPTEEMRVLAGLDRIKYVLVYPETHDIVLAGPAGDWKYDTDGRVVRKDSGRPVLQLDDLVLITRHMLSAEQTKFGCAITPTQEALAGTQEFVAESNKHPLREGQRDQWLSDLRDHMGRQNIDVFGIDGRTRVGRVLVEADYRMKLVGVGLEDGVMGCPSYLSMIQVDKDGKVPPLSVLRWWFTLNYNSIQATRDHDGFELRGQGVKVLSENELLTQTGQRVHTGDSDVLNAEFAHNFTQHFPELAAKYPVYADLQNIFDMALVGALLKAEKLPERVDWHLTCFGDPQQYKVAELEQPKTVETVINHRIVNRSIILVGVSGGVSVDPSALVAPSAMQADYGVLREQHSAAKPKAAVPNVWWWD